MVKKVKLFKFKIIFPKPQNKPNGAKELNFFTGHVCNSRGAGYLCGSFYGPFV